MEPFKISPITREIVIRFSNEEVELPANLQGKIDAYWNELISSGRPYKRGEVFTVTDVKETPENIEVIVSKTDYAHYLYSQNVDPLGKHSVRIIHTAGPIITSDNNIIFGQMGPQTARAGIYQLCGGGLDNNDLQEDGTLDPTHNIIQEFQEEFGVDIHDSKRAQSFAQKYLKTGGPTGKMTLIYVAQLKDTKEQFLERYKSFEKDLQVTGEMPEFENIVAFSLDDTTKLQTFLQDDRNEMDEYLRPFLEFLTKEKR